MATRTFCGRRGPATIGRYTIKLLARQVTSFIYLSGCETGRCVTFFDGVVMCRAQPRSMLASKTATDRTSDVTSAIHANPSSIATPARMNAPLQSATNGLARPATRDPRRLIAFAAALAATAELSYWWLSEQPSLPPLGSVITGPVPIAVSVLLCGFSVGLLAAKIVMGDLFHVELHRGRLYICAGVPSIGPPLPSGAVLVRSTGDVRGNGAYATMRIPVGTHIADYDGELLNQAAFIARYPDNKGDYAMAIDDEWIIDGAALAASTSNFHAVHMNHSRSRANVRRYYKRRERRVRFFAARDIEPGEELLYDYGRSYWYGREHLELP